MIHCSVFVFIVLSIMVVHDEDLCGIFLVHSGHGSLDMKVTYLYELVELKVSKTLFKIVPVSIARLM